MEGPYDKKKGRRQGDMILTSWAHMVDNPIRSFQFPTWDSNLGLGLHEWLDFCWDPATNLTQSFYFYFLWYNGIHKMEIIPKWYYAEELIFLSTQKLYHMTEKYWILWMPHAFFYVLQRKKIITRVLITSLKLAMWMCNFCQKKTHARKYSKSFICFNELQNQLLAPNFFNMHPFSYCYI